MSNVLRFKSFHERHFSPDQVKHWQSILNQQSGASQWQRCDTSQPYSSQHGETTAAENYEEEYYEEEYNEEYDEEELQDTEAPTLSEEAIEIFRFSEAYRKEREEEEAQEEEEEHGKLITDAYRNGVEAPASCLIHYESEESNSADVRILEHLLDSEYLDACRDGQAVLWPVLPLRL